MTVRVACDSEVTAPGMWTQCPKLSSEQHAADILRKRAGHTQTIYRSTRPILSLTPVVITEN